MFGLCNQQWWYISPEIRLHKACEPLFSLSSLAEVKHCGLSSSGRALLGSLRSPTKRPKGMRDQGFRWTAQGVSGRWSFRPSHAFGRFSKNLAPEPFSYAGPLKDYRDKKNFILLNFGDMLCNNGWLIYYIIHIISNITPFCNRLKLKIKACQYCIELKYRIIYIDFIFSFFIIEKQSHLFCPYSYLRWNNQWSNTHCQMILIILSIDLGGTDDKIKS